MKKTITLILAAVLCLSFVTGCKSKEEKERDQLVKQAQQAVKDGDYSKAAELMAGLTKDAVDSGAVEKMAGAAADAMQSAIDSGAVEKMADAVQSATSDSKTNDNDSKNKVKKVAVTDNAILEQERFKLKIKSYEIKSGPTLVITYDFTNKEDEHTNSFNMFSYNVQLYQDGINLPESFSTEEKEQSTHIKDGVTIEVVKAYSLRNTTSDILFECNGARAGYGGDIVSTYTLKLEQ